MADHNFYPTFNRRHFLTTTGCGIGIAALNSLLGADSSSKRKVAAVAPGPGAAKKGQPGLPTLPHFPAKAKRVVCLWQGGGPSHIDLFDYKPAMEKMALQDIPESVRGGT